MLQIGSGDVFWDAVGWDGWTDPSYGWDAGYGQTDGDAGWIFYDAVTGDETWQENRTASRAQADTIKWCFI